MGILKNLGEIVRKAMPSAPPVLASNPFPVGDPRHDTLGAVLNSIQASGGGTTAERFVASLIAKSASVQESSTGLIGINDYGFKGKRQYIADRRYLLDLYVIANNNADVRTAVTHLRNEIFRRGLEWEPAFEWKCPVCRREFSEAEAAKIDYKCSEPIRNDDGQVMADVDEKGKAHPLHPDLESPDETQRDRFDKFLRRCNHFGQSLEVVLRECEDDLNVVDDAFILISKDYYGVPQEDGSYKLRSEPRQIFRLDPVLVEFDLDQRGIPGQRHHICLLHRDNLLEVPAGEGWEYEWKGHCPDCGLQTFPVWYKYNEQYLQGGYGCFAHDTEVLTRNGWKRFPDILDTDEIASLDGGKLIWQRPITRFEYDYNGDLWRLKHKRADLLVTPNHNVYAQVAKSPTAHLGDTSWGLVRADSMPKYLMSWVKADAGWDGAEIPFFIIPPYRQRYGRGVGYEKARPARVVPMDLWLEFLGYYIAEGSADGGRGLRIKIAQSRGKHPETYERIRQTIKALGFNHTAHDNGVYIYDVQVGRCLAWLGKSHQKYIPQMFKNLSARQLGILFWAYMAGDGSRHHKGDPNAGWCASTVSPRLADDLMEIALKLGWQPSVSTRQRGDPARRHPTYELMFSHRPIRAMRGQWRPEHYEGKIYSVQVPGGVLYVRRNGKACWSGNSAQSKVLYLTSDEVTHWSRYTPSELYGYPPILSVYEKALTLIGMDRYLYDYFYERRVPQGIIATVTDDVQGLESRKAEMAAKMQQDPHYIPWIAVNSKTGQGKTEFVRFAYSLDELNYLPVRDEIRERVAGLYGVSQIWMSSVAGVGGLNSESQQLVVMSRVVEGAQRSYHTEVFPSLMDAFGITDWKLQLAIPEEQSELMRLNLLQQKGMFAQTMAMMGFGVEYDPDTEKFTYSGKVLSMEDQQKQAEKMGGGMPGMGGGGQGGGGQGGGMPGQGGGLF